MKYRLALAMMLFCAWPCFGQQAKQTATCGRANVQYWDGNPTLVSCSFSQPIVAGDLLVAVAESACPTVDTIACNPISGDTLGNVWQTALHIGNDTRPSLYYALNAVPGIDTVYFIPGDVLNVVLLEYPPALALDSANSNFRGSPSDLQNLAQNFTREDLAWALPIVMPSAKELVIGYSLSGSLGMSATAGPGFYLEATSAGILAVEDELETDNGLCVASLRWNEGAPWWIMGVASFKMK